MDETAPTRPRAEGFALIGLGAGARLIGVATAAFAGLATIALAVRLLGTGPYGVFAFAFSTAAVFGGVGRLGLEPAVARSAAILQNAGDRPGMARVARGAFTLVALTGAVGTLATLAVVELDSHSLGATTKLALGGFLGLVLYGANTTAVGAALARGTGRVAVMELSMLAPALGKLGAVALLTALDLADVRWVAAGYAAGAVGGVAASWGAASLVVGRCRALLPDLGAAREMFVGSLPFAVVGLATIVISRFDVVVLGLTGSPREVGAYEPVLKVVEQAMLLVPMLFASQYLPVASRLFTRSDLVDFREVYVGVSKLVFVVASPAAILFAAFPETVQRTLYGAGFPTSGLVAWLLLPGFVANLAFGLNTAALSAVGNRRALAQTGLIATAAMVLLAVVLVPLFGPKGAAGATSATYVILNVAAAVALLRAAGVHPFRSDFVATMVTWLGPLAAALAIRAALSSVDVWQAAGLSIGLSAVWVAFLFAGRILRLQEITRLLPGRR